MKLAGYEKRDLRATKRVRRAVGLTTLLLAAWLAFWVFPPAGWANDGPWVGSGPWLWETFIDSYTDVLAEWHTVIPAYTHAIAAFTTAWRIPILTGMVFEFYARIIGCLLATFLAWIVASQIMIRDADIVDTRKHYEGLELQQGAAAKKSLSEFMDQEDGERGLGIALAAGIILSRLREIRGLLLLGAPGSGKTRIILHFLQEILAAMYRWPARYQAAHSRHDGRNSSRPTVARGGLCRPTWTPSRRSRLGGRT